MPEIDDDLLQRIPSEMLINELKRRLNTFMCFVSDALSYPASSPLSEQVKKAEEAEAAPLNEAASKLQSDTSANRYAKARQAGLAVPGGKTDADLAPGHFPTRTLPMTDVMRNPDQRAAMDRAVEQAYSSPGAAEVRAELEAMGEAGLVSELDRAVSLRSSSQMRAPGLAAIVAINKRSNGDAFIQPILPPSIAGAVQVPTVTEISWFDDPAVVTLDLEALVTNKTPQRAGVPATSLPEIQRRADELAKAVKAIRPVLKTDGFTGHLPSPILQITGTELRLLLEPVVIWRLLIHLGPRIRYVHIEENLREALNQCITEHVPEAERILISAGPEMGARDFRDRVTALLQTRFFAARTEDKGKLSQAIRRQIRILNPDMQEVGMPSDKEAEGMHLQDPRALLEGRVVDGPGTMRGLAPLASNVARLAALRKISGKDTD